MGVAAQVDWRPEPVVVTAGAAHRQVATLHADATAHVEWSEVVVLGRHDEEPGRAELRLDATVDGRVLLRHALRVGPGATGWDGPAVLAGCRAVAQRLVLGPALVAPARTSGPGWAWMALDGPGWLLVATAHDLMQLAGAVAEAGSPTASW